MWETNKELPFGDGLYHLFICNMSKWLAAYLGDFPQCDFLSCPPFAFLNLRYCGRNLQYMPRAIQSDTAAVENVEVGSGRQEVLTMLTIQES